MSVYITEGGLVSFSKKKNEWRIAGWTDGIKYTFQYSVSGENVEFHFSSNPEEK